MPRFFIEFSYDGTNYHGLQKQPNSNTIQEVIETNLSKFLRSEINLTLAGRTDSGVHAKQMFSHFDVNNEFDVENFCSRLNSMLPNDICIESLKKVKDDAHCRFDADSRTYEYTIISKKDPFNYKYSYYLKENLDIKKMNNMCKLLIANDDFKCFSKSNTDVKTYICDIKEAEWIMKENTYIFKITADRFLRNMVRSIVGTMIEAGKNKISEKDFQKIIDSRDRSAAGYSVPSSGLTLLNINYKKIFINSWKK